MQAVVDWQPEMIFLLLSTIFNSAFGLIVRYSQRKGSNLFVVGAINYVTAALFHTIVMAAGGLARPHTATVLIGALGGLFYSGTFLLLCPFMLKRGVSIAATVARLSMLIPVLFALLIWGESARAIQLVGGVVALAALPFLTFRPRVDKRKLDAGSVLLLFAVFFAAGLCALSIRWYHQTGIRGEEATFLAFLFGTAAMVVGTTWLLRRDGSSARDIPPGFVLGLVNAVGNRLLIAALRQLPSIVVYPFSSVVGLLITILFSLTVWRERITRVEIIGIAIASVSILLVNLGLGG